jgi:hypothetical protein
MRLGGLVCFEINVNLIIISCLARFIDFFGFISLILSPIDFFFESR